MRLTLFERSLLTVVLLSAIGAMSESARAQPQFGDCDNKCREKKTFKDTRAKVQCFQLKFEDCGYCTTSGVCRSEQPPLAGSCQSTDMKQEEVRFVGCMEKCVPNWPIYQYIEAEADEQAGLQDAMSNPKNCKQ